MLNKDSAICIRAVDYSETSQVLTFFTRSFGKIRAIAKGSKRPKSAFGGAIEPLSLGRIVFSGLSGDRLATITEFEQQSCFEGSGKDFSVLNAALFAAELIDRMSREADPHPELFDSFEQFLKNISDAGGRENILKLLILFELCVLKQVGLQPVLNSCCNCKKKFGPAWRQCFFSSSANGLICRDCEAHFADKIRISNKASSTLSNLRLLADADKATVNELESLLICHLTVLLDKPLKMAKYILEK